MAKEESKVIKPFLERDIQRMRNLITKKYGDKTVQQVGYQKENIEHVEGDEWEENKKTWTIKGGIKQTITKLDSLKQILQLPLVCPKCKKSMKKKELDRKMFFLHKMCFDCVIQQETELKRDGKFEEYEKNILKSNVESFIKDLEQDFAEFCVSNNESFITEHGDIENWQGGQIDFVKISSDLKEYIAILKSTVGL
jgi:hypothetical protein